MFTRKRLISIAIAGVLAGAGTTAMADCDEQLEAFESQLEEAEMSDEQREQYEGWIDTAGEMAEEGYMQTCVRMVSDMQSILSSGNTVADAETDEDKAEAEEAEAEEAEAEYEADAELAQETEELEQETEEAAYEVEEETEEAADETAMAMNEAEQETEHAMHEAEEGTEHAMHEAEEETEEAAAETSAALEEAGDEIKETSEQAKAKVADAVDRTINELDDEDIFNVSGEEIAEVKGFVTDPASGETYIVAEIEEGFLQERDVVVPVDDFELTAEGRLIYNGSDDISSAEELDEERFEKIEESRTLTQVLDES